ncbi:MAG TPA: tetratricopeptide repeat protein, partial [Bryobacteraceae bacterium]
MGNTKSALDALKEAVTLMPGQDLPLVELGNFLLVGYVANPRHPADLYKQISAIADQLLGKNADSFEGTKFRGFLTTTENDPAIAVSLLSKANRLKPGDAGVVTVLFESLIRSGQKEQAETIALDFLRQRPNYGPLYTMLSQYYLQSGRKADAEEILKRKAERNPKNGLYRVELARFYSRGGQTAQAQAVLDAMTGDSKNFPQGYVDAGDYYLESRNWQEARREYALGAQNDQKSGTIYLKRLMRVALAMNDRPSAEQLVEQILKQQPDDRDAEAARADLEMASTDPSKISLAIAEFKKLVDEAPGNSG